MSIDPCPPPAETGRAAAFYLAQGRIPIPVPRVGNCKAPHLADWQRLRPTPADLDRLFPACQALNIGLLLGAPSGGLIDVDLDAVEAVAAGPLLLPPTGWVSGREGKQRSHWWYIVDDPPSQASQQQFRDVDQSMLAELRSTGGHTVAPPGVHESGERIQWHKFTEPAHVALADLHKGVARTAAAALLARHWPAKGGRQDAALASAGGLAKAGWGAEEIERFVRAVATAAGDEEVEMRCQVADQSAAKVAAGKKVWGWPKLAEFLGEQGDAVVDRVRTWLGLRDAKPHADSKRIPIRPPDPYRPFPVEALPEPIRSYVVQGAAALGTDPTFLALPALSVVASLIGNARSIRLKRDWYEPAVVWTGVVGDSGTLKSPAASAVTGALYRLQKELIKQFKLDKEQYEKDKSAYEERKREAKKEEIPFVEEEPEAPKLVRVVTGDVTIEKLAELLEDNPKGLLTCRDELGGWLGSFTRYKGKGGGSQGRRIKIWRLLAL